MKATITPTSEDRFLQNARRIANAAKIILREEQRPACSPAELLRDKKALTLLIITYDLRVAQGRVHVPEAARSAVGTLREWTLLGENLQYAMLAEMVND